MPEPTLQELKDKLHQANDSYHEVVGDIFLSEYINVGYKSIVGSRANRIFDLMNDLNKFMDNL